MAAGMLGESAEPGLDNVNSDRLAAAGSERLAWKIPEPVMIAMCTTWNMYYRDFVYRRYH
jgi:hypothetical protein